MRVVVLGLLGTVLAGRESVAAPYPSDWPPLRTAGRDCRSVAGAYAQHGEHAPGGTSTPYARLTWLATGRELELYGGDAAHFSFPEPDVFEIRAEREVRRWSLRETGAACHTGRLELRRRAYLGIELVPFGPHWKFKRVSFAKLHDGSLVAEDDAVHWLLLFFVIPMRGRYVDWYRYPPPASP